MYEQTFTAYGYMRNVSFGCVGKVLHEHYRAVELVEAMASSMDDKDQQPLRRHLIQGLGSRLFANFSVSALDEHRFDAPKSLNRAVFLPGVVRFVNLERLVDQAHDTLGALKPMLAEKSLGLTDLYDGSTVTLDFLPTDLRQLPERLFWLRAFGLAAYELLRDCLEDNLRHGEEDACPVVRNPMAGLSK